MVQEDDAVSGRDRRKSEFSESEIRIEAEYAARQCGNPDMGRMGGHCGESIPIRPGTMRMDRTKMLAVSGFVNCGLMQFAKHSARGAEIFVFEKLTFSGATN